MYDTLICQLERLAKAQPDKLAVAFKTEQLTYKALYEKIVTVAEGLVALGISRGDRVVFTALSKPEMVAVYLGIQYIGAVAVFADKNGTPENIAMVYEESGAVLLLTDKPMKEYAEHCNIYSLKMLDEGGAGNGAVMYTIPAETEIAELLFTTGTTGKPKGVKLSYKSVYHILSNTTSGIGIQETDRVLIPLPLNHSFALRVLRAVLYSGATVILQNGFTFAKEIENNMNLYACTAMTLVPASVETVHMQMQDKFAEIIGRMRYIEVGAGSLTISQRKKLTAMLPNTTIYNTWGSSESGGALFLNVTAVVDDAQKVGAVGKPLGNIQVQVLDEARQPMAETDAQHAGRMAIKGDMVMAGYWNREDLTAETLVDGWLLTNDMVYTDADGYVYMLGRADDIINVGGEKVSPIEVENIAGQYPLVKECACIGVDDPKGIMGQVPVLFVVAKSSLFTEDDLQKFLTAHMERYKLPQKYILIQELPRNKMQKIDRKALKKLWENPEQLELMNPVMQAIFSRRSIRKFTEQPIPKEILELILKAAYYAPSGHNMQSWRFTVIESQESIARLKELSRITAQEHKVHFYGFDNPQCIILISNDSRNPDGCQDASCAAQNIFLAAQSYGIGSVWLNPLMTLRDKEPVKSLLDEYGIPQNHVVWSMVALGYPYADGKELAKKKDVIHYVDR